MVGSVAMAQDHGQGKKHAHDKQHMQAERMDKLISELELNEDEAARFRLVVEENKAEMKAMREKEKAAMKEKRDALRKTHESRIREVLTEEQFTRFLEIKAERMEKRKAMNSRETEEMPELERAE
jgi:hypothetical protein